MTNYLIGNSEHFVLDPSVTLLKGSDSLKVIDRTVTTKLTKMDNLARQRTLFCDANGRIIDQVLIINIGGQLLVISDKGASQETRKKLVTGVSWDEDCEVLNADNAISQILIVCENPDLILANFQIELEQLTNNRVLEKGDLLISIKKYTPCYIISILAPKERLDDLLASLEKSKSKIGLQNRWDFLRINNGIPSLLDSRGKLPVDLGMGGLISLDKGCYPGQEIHARMDSKGKSAKQLLRIKSENKLDVGKISVSDLGRIFVTSSATNEDISLSLAICDSIIDDQVSFILPDGTKAVAEILSSV